MNESYLTTGNPLSSLPGPLLAWFRQNARDLPWRRTADPYKIWVSEIMLQQTRVAAVLGYYARFLDAFPSVEALAAAPEERLLKLWEGLGYYSRAKNLQKCARQVTGRYGGRFPADYGQLLALPGIGEYTAGAIASAAFGLRVPAVDGNVLRVAARISDSREDITGPQTKKNIRARIREIMPTDPADVRIFNQATMELGATVCVPNGPPKCGACPAEAFCLGRRRGTADRLPVKAPRKARRVEDWTVFVFLRDGKTALRKRPPAGLLAGLWEFPNVSGELDGPAAAEAVRALDLTAVEWRKKLTAKHIFTHVEWRMTGYALEVSGSGPGDLEWVNAGGLQAHAVPSAFGRYYREALAFLEKEDMSCIC